MWRFWALLVWVLPSLAGAEIISARYSEPTDIYNHGAVPEHEFLALEFTLSSGVILRAQAKNAVYEGLEPILADLDFDRSPEVISVVSSFKNGAALLIWGEDPSQKDVIKLLAQTPPIGAKHRWLSPIGVGDFDQDGFQEIAYIETPHLGKTLRIWRYKDRLEHVIDLPGLTNHRFGESFTLSGIQNCDGQDKIVTVDVNYQNIILSFYKDGEWLSLKTAPYSPENLKKQLTCQTEFK